ncbi:MAG: hypothetical protein AB7P03_15440 [Kofleriaceae bacterium]
MKAGLGENSASRPVVHKVQDVISGVADRVGHVAERVTDVGTRAKDSASRRIESVGDLIAQHPIVALSIGLGIGYLFARIRRR